MQRCLISFFFIPVLVLALACGGDSNSSEFNASMQRGALVYRAKCLTCHMSNGKGVPNVYPPLAKSDYLLADKLRAIRQALYGAQGEIVVNGQTYSGIMPPQDLSDQDVTDVLNYIFNSWGNSAGSITSDDVSSQRKKLSLD